MPQYARPVSTIAAGGWTAVSAPTHHEATDEETPNGDTDYAQAGSTAGTLKLGLSSVSDPGVGTGHTLRVSVKALGSKGPERLDGWLYEGAALIATAFAAVSITRDSYNLYEYTLTEAEANAITDYGNLAVWLAPNSVASGEYLRDTWVEFEVPEGSQVHYQDIPATEVTAASVDAMAQLKRAFGAIMAGMGGMSRAASFYRTLAVALSGGAVLAAAKSLYRVIAGTAVGGLSIVKKGTRYIGIAAVNVPSIARAKVFLKELVALTVGNAALGRRAKHYAIIAAVAVGGVVNETRALFRRGISIISTAVLGLDPHKLAGALYYRTLAVGSEVLISLSRLSSLARSITGSASVVSAVGRLARRYRGITATLVSLPALAREVLGPTIYYKAVSAIAGTQAGVSRLLSLTRGLTAAVVTQSILGKVKVGLAFVLDTSVSVIKFVIQGLRRREALALKVSQTKPFNMKTTYGHGE